MKKFFNLIFLLSILSINLIEGRKISNPNRSRSQSAPPSYKPAIQELPLIDNNRLKELEQKIAINDNTIKIQDKIIEDLKIALRAMEQSLINQKNSSGNNDFMKEQISQIHKMIKQTTSMQEINRNSQAGTQNLNYNYPSLPTEPTRDLNRLASFNEYDKKNSPTTSTNKVETPVDYLVGFNKYDKEKSLENSPGKVLREGKIVEKKKEIFKNFFEKKKKDYLKFLMPIAALKLIIDWANENKVDFIPDVKNFTKYIPSKHAPSLNAELLDSVAIDRRDLDPKESNKKENTEILNNEIIISLAKNSKSFYGSLENSHNFHMFINTTEEFLDFINSEEGKNQIKNYCKKHSHSLKEFLVVKKELEKELEEKVEEKLTAIIIKFLFYFKSASSIKPSVLNSTLISPLSLPIIPVFHDFLTFTPININKNSDHKTKEAFKFSDEAINEINKFFNIKVKYKKVQEKLSVKISKHFRENKKKYIALGVAVGLIALGEISKKIIQGGYTGFGSKFLDSYSKNYTLGKDFALSGAKKLGEKAKSAGLKTKTFLEEKTKDFPGKVTKMTKNFSQKAKGVGEKFSEKAKGAFSKIFKKNENIDSINQNPYQSDMKIEPNPKLTSNENKNFEPFKPYLDKSPLEKDLIDYAKNYQPTGLL